MSKKFLIPIEVDSGIANTVGIKANRINVSSPISEGAKVLGINSNGDFVLTQLPMWRIKLAAASTNSSNTTLTTLTGVQFSAEANKTYRIKANLIYRTAATGTGLALGLVIPSGNLVGVTTVVIGAAGTGSSFEGNIVASNAVNVSTGVQAANKDYMAEIEAIITVGATAGNIAPVFRSEVNGSLVTIQANSVMVVEEF